MGIKTAHSWGGGQWTSFKSTVLCLVLSLLSPVSALAIPQIYPMAVVATAERGLIVYQLENQPSEFRRIESPLKHQVSRKSDQEAGV